MADQRRTFTSALIHMAVVFLSASPYCLAEPQGHSNIPVLDLSSPPFTHNMDPDIFGTPTVTPDPLEYLERPDDLDEAVYAGRFAIELGKLETQNNDLFTNFITDGFVSDEVPRYLPKMLRMLSRSRNNRRTGFYGQQGDRSTILNSGRNNAAVSAGGQQGGVLGVSTRPPAPASTTTGGVTSSSRPTSAAITAAAATTAGGSSAGGNTAPPTTTLLPIEKGRLVTKTTTTDFGSLSPYYSSRNGRIHENKYTFPSHMTDENKFRFPSRMTDENNKFVRFPSLAQIFHNQHTRFTY